MQKGYTYRPVTGKKARDCLRMSNDNENKDGMLETAKVMTANDYPRRTFNANGGQVKAPGMYQMVETVKSTNGESDAFYSVYSFPEGHPTNTDSVPKVDTLYFDFDIEDNHIYNLTEDEDDWKDALNDLLDVINEVVMDLYMRGASPHWRFVLSGHKGVHFYLDFPQVDPGAGNKVRYKDGLKAAAQEILDRWERNIKVDVNKYADEAVLGDISRLSRMPNTVHPGATERFDETRYCVPVTAEELIDMDAEEYAEITSEPRIPDGFERNPNTKARTFVRQHIFNAIVAMDGTLPTYGEDDKTSMFKPHRIEDYKRETKGTMDSLDDAWFLINKPCIKAFYDGDWEDYDTDGGQFSHGSESHWMELYVMSHLVAKGVPYEICVDFFRGFKGFNERETKERLNQLIGRGYSKMTCKKLRSKAERFCLGSRCPLYEGEESKECET